MSTSDENSVDYDLIVISGTAAGLSVAISMRDAGLGRVRVIVPPGETISFPDLIAENQVEVGYNEALIGIDYADEVLSIETDQRTYRASAALVATRNRNPEWAPPIPYPASEKITIDTLPEGVRDSDILIVGHTNHAVELAAEAAAAGAGTVLAAGGPDPAQLAPAPRRHSKRRLLADRHIARCCVLPRDRPDRTAIGCAQASAPRRRDL